MTIRELKDFIEKLPDDLLVYSQNTAGGGGDAKVDDDAQRGARLRRR